MCQRLYIATRQPLKLVRRTKATPYLEVREADPRSQVRNLFGKDRPYIYLAGAHVECGCGFPSLTAPPHAEPSAPHEADSRSMLALADHIRPACRKHSTVEMYLCWAHEESEPAVGRRTLSLPDLRDGEFRFCHRELLTVGRAP
jgi:hypothetical protein